MLTTARYLAHLEQDAGSLIDIMRSGDLDAGVPACPGWTLRDLGRHLGAIHRWAADVVRTGRPAAEPIGPVERAELVDWMERGANSLLDSLRTADPDAPTWTFGPKPRQVSFWSRRQAQETSIHLVDAVQSVEGSHLMDPYLASDGIDEVVGFFFPRQVRLERMPPLTCGIRLVATDGSGESFDLAGDGTEQAPVIDATITGAAADLLLALWRRGGIDHLSIDGDPSAVRNVLSAAITP